MLHKHAVGLQMGAAQGQIGSWQLRASVNPIYQVVPVQADVILEEAASGQVGAAETDQISS